MKSCLSFAINADGHVVSIDEVPSGLACNSTCAGCGEALVAKKGTKLDHHFAHASGSECASAYESSLHLGVKTLLERHRKLRLPDCIAVYEKVDDHDQLSYPKEDPRRLLVDQRAYDIMHPQSGVAYIKGSLIEFDYIAVEQDVGSIRPDIIGYRSDIPLYIEVGVTHFVDDVKLAKLRKLGVSAIELDFSSVHRQAWTWDTLEEQLFSAVTDKQWLLNRKAERIAQADWEMRTERIARLEAQRAQYEMTHRIQISFADMQKYVFHNVFFELNAKALTAYVVGQQGHKVAVDFHRVLKAQHNAVFDTRERYWQMPPDVTLMVNLACWYKRLILKYRPTFHLDCPEDQEADLRQQLGMPPKTRI